MILFVLLAFQDPAFEERRLATFPQQQSITAVEFNGDGTAVYFRAADPRTKLERVYVNDRPGEWFDEVQELQFLPDGKSVRYRARKGTQSFTVVGDKVSGPNDEISYPVPLYGGKTLGRLSLQGGRSTLVVGDKRSEAFPIILWPALSPDGSTVAFVGRREGPPTADVVVVNGVKGPEFDWATAPGFAKDGKTVVYAARDASKKWHVIAGDQKWGPFEDALLVLNTQGVGFACQVRQGSKMYVIADGTKGDEYDQVGGLEYNGIPRYGASRGDLNYVVAGDWKSPGHKRLYSDAMGPDGKTPTYIAGDKTLAAYYGDKKLADGFDQPPGYAVSPDGRVAAVVVDRKIKMGDRSFEFDGLPHTPLFSPDGKHLACVVEFRPDPASDRSEACVAVDGQKGEMFDEIGDLRFLPAGGRVSYKARKGDAWHLVVGTRKGPAYRFIYSVVSSPDGTKVAYGATDGSGAHWKVTPVGQE